MFVRSYLLMTLSVAISVIGCYGKPNEPELLEIDSDGNAILIRPEKYSATFTMLTVASVPVGTPITLVCNGYANQDTRIQWTFRDEIVPFQNDEIFGTNVQAYMYGPGYNFTSFLDINSAQEENGGIYHCYAYQLDDEMNFERGDLSLNVR